MYRIEMIVDGKSVKKIKHAGKTYLPVVKGDAFQIKITNDSNHRICAVVSVDGLSVMNGKNASHNDSGYVIEVNDCVMIDGWRRGNDEVAQFQISSRDESYAGKTNRPVNIGVVGVVVFPEARRAISGQSAWPYGDDPWKPYKSPLPNPIEQPTIRCMSSNQSAGTAYGDKIESHVSEVEFAKNPLGKKVIVLYYDTVEALRKKGVPVDCHVGNPNPFPAEDSAYFCPEP